MISRRRTVNSCAPLVLEKIVSTIRIGGGVILRVTLAPGAGTWPTWPVVIIGVQDLDVIEMTEIGQMIQPLSSVVHHY